LKSLRGGVIGGSLVPMTLMKRIFNDFGMKEMSSAYGMTELSPVVCMTFASDPLEI
jgi:fatty-acyl-CoA synthase